MGRLLDRTHPQNPVTHHDHTAEILNVLIHLSNQGLSHYVIKTTDNKLNYLNKRTDLNNPEDVKHTIAQANGGTGYKRILTDAYNKYAQYHNIEWERPKYRETRKLRRIPTGKQIDTLIQHATRALKIKLQIAKQTGLRPIETLRLKTQDFDPDKQVFFVEASKNGNPRILKISNQLTQTLTHYIKKHPRQDNKIFGGKSENFTKAYMSLRNRLTTRLKQPQLKTIRLYDFRHYFATNLYAKTRDILLVKQKMGHKKIDTTMIYTQYIETLTKNDEYTCKATTNDKEATQLLENGFNYKLTTPNGLMLFRKRK